jgi:hypothetical protein
VFSNISSATIGQLYIGLGNTGNTTYLGIESSVGGTVLGGSSAYATVFGTYSAQALQFATTNLVRQTITAAGLAQFTGAVQAGSATAGTATAGDVWASRSTTTGAIVIGGSSNSSVLDYNITNVNSFTCSTNFAVGGNLAVSSTGSIIAGSLGLTGSVAGLLCAGAVAPGHAGTQGNCGLYGGTGVPSFSATNGSIFLRYDGSTASTVFYVNTSGASSSGTTWSAVTIP